MQKHLTGREIELHRLRAAALAAGQNTGLSQREVERRVVALCDLCVKLLLWEKDAPRLTGEQLREREAFGCWTADPPGEYLIGLINDLPPLWQKVNDMGAAIVGSIEQRESPEGDGVGSDPKAGGKSSKRKRGRPTASDPKRDKRLYEDWKASGLAAKDFARNRGLKRADVEAAAKRHRMRLKRRYKIPHTKSVK